MCQWFFASQFYEGVLDLVLVCASKLDPRNVGFDYYKNKEPSEDSEGYRAFLQRYFAMRAVCLHSIQLANRRSCVPVLLLFRIANHSYVWLNLSWF